MVADAVGDLEAALELAGAPIELMDVAPVLTRIDGRDPDVSGVEIQALDVEELTLQRQDVDELRAFDAARWLGLERTCGAGQEKKGGRCGFDHRDVREKERGRRWPAPQLSGIETGIRRW
ncbi:hypothetical protein ACRAWD_16680 [Caulobacter segnis]